MRYLYISPLAILLYFLALVGIMYSSGIFHPEIILIYMVVVPLSFVIGDYIKITKKRNK